MTLIMRTTENGETITQFVCPLCRQTAPTNHVFCGSCGTKLSTLDLDLPTIHVNYHNPCLEFHDHTSGKQQDWNAQTAMLPRLNQPSPKDGMIFEIVTAIDSETRKQTTYYWPIRRINHTY